MYGFYGEGLKIPDDEKRALALLNGTLLREAIQAGPRLPATLFQYTSAAGLKGIVESGRVHATHIAYMNDKSEYRIGVHLFEEILKSEQASSPEIVALFGDMRPRLAVTSPFDFSPTFVACLSAARNDLNQWRAYSGGTGGYCIGFDAQRLWNKAYGLGGFLAPVLYDKELAKVHLSKFFNAAIAEYLRVSKKYEGEEKNEHRLQWVIAFFALASNLLPILKHESFQDEREWRVVYPLQYTTEVMTRARYRTNILCPYVELKLGEPNDYPKSWPADSPGRRKPLPDLLPIQEVLAGPSEEEELAYISARALLESYAYGGVTVAQSGLPYRTTI